MQLEVDKDRETWKQQASQIIFQSLLPHIWYHLWTHDASFPDWQSNTVKIGKVDRCSAVNRGGADRDGVQTMLLIWKERWRKLVNLWRQTWEEDAVRISVHVWSDYACWRLF